LDKRSTSLYIPQNLQNLSKKLNSAVRKLTHAELSITRLQKEKIEEAERTPLFGLLDNIRSLYNVGSIFRTSDGGFIRGLYLCGYTPVPPRKEIEKTALGATQSVPWKHFKDPLEAVKDAREAGARICVLELTTESRPYFEIRREDFPLCLVVGNEITGVSAPLLAEADMALEIPMYGTKQSLNAAVAYGIALFHLVRIWKQR
jgi:tRNA G18 (ribose-2'-O)-methylase SpoU